MTFSTIAGSACSNATLCGMLRLQWAWVVESCCSFVRRFCSSVIALRILCLASAKYKISNGAVEAADLVRICDSYCQPHICQLTSLIMPIFSSLDNLKGLSL
jgi:hypothetical protein